MECKEAVPLLEAAVDGELEVVREHDLEAHLDRCPGCARLAAGIRARGAALHAALPRFTAPSRVAQAIRARLPAVPPARAAWNPFYGHWRAVGVAAAFLLAIGLPLIGARDRAQRGLLRDEAIAGHIRSLQLSHLFDVASTDRHTVKPWFQGKLDFSPPVVDLAAAGFPLAGGRMDNLGGRAAAALVYRLRKHTINLFVWPGAAAEVSDRVWLRRGYAVAAWREADLDFIAVSDVPISDLSAFESAFRAATAERVVPSG